MILIIRQVENVERSFHKFFLTRNKKKLSHIYKFSYYFSYFYILNLPTSQINLNISIINIITDSHTQIVKAPLYSLHCCPTLGVWALTDPEANAAVLLDW